MRFYGNCSNFTTINIPCFTSEMCQLDKIIHYTLHTCPKVCVNTRLALRFCARAISTKTTTEGSRSLACQNTVIALHLIFLNPANSSVELLSARAAQLRKQDYSLWQHLEAARASRREKWSWLTAADNDTAIFIFVFGKGQLRHSTTNHSQLLLFFFFV